MNKIYQLIQDNPLKYNSVELAKELNTTDSDIRESIKMINEDTKQFQYGIVSDNHKYKLAKSGNDFKKKVEYYKSRHKQAYDMEQIWLKRQDMVAMERKQIEPFIMVSVVEDYCLRQNEFEIVKFIMDQNNDPQGWGEDAIDFIRDKYWSIKE